MDNTKDLYLDLMKKSLTGLLWNEASVFKPVNVVPHRLKRKFILRAIANHLSKTGKQIMEPAPFVMEDRVRGVEWPPPVFAQTMIGLKRLDNLQFCIEEVIRNNVQGDLIETGVWRGGAVIFMRAVLKAHGITNRRVWVADSFEGLPAPNPSQYPADKRDDLHKFDFLRVSLEEVQANFARYGLLDEQVRFLKGWFRDTLPRAPIQQLAVMRLDGDMYESTMDALSHLYPKLSVGGYCIIDDYSLKNCRQAVYDFRARYGIEDRIIDIDGSGVYWQSTATIKAASTETVNAN
jgi:hypothetical protein